MSRRAKFQPSVSQLREQTWLLGPSAAADIGLVPTIVRRISVPEDHQQIFQSHVAALEQAKRGTGVALAASFAVSQDIANGYLKRISGPSVQTQGVWSVLALDGRLPSGSAAWTLVRWRCSLIVQ